MFLTDYVFFKKQRGAGISPMTSWKPPQDEETITSNRIQDAYVSCAFVPEKKELIRTKTKGMATAGLELPIP